MEEIGTIDNDDLWHNECFEVGSAERINSCLSGADWSFGF